MRPNGFSSGGSSQAVYQCTALIGTNKKGILPCDEDGYYTLCVGGLDVYNSVGAFYKLAPARALFDASSDFQRRIANGNCKGECGHPKKLPGQSIREFIMRVCQIEETRVCCQFRKVWLEPREGNGRNYVAIMAELTPSGPMGPALEKALNNPHENVTFSVRSLTRDAVNPQGILEKSMKTLVTFDWVTEQGIAGAHKYASPSLESLIEVSFNNEHLVEPKLSANGVSASMEQQVSFENIRNDFGWKKGQLQNPSSLPSMNW